MADERGPLVKAKVQLVLNHPFFGVLICHLPTVPLPPAEMAVLCGGAPTAAVDGKTIYFNEEWINSLPEKARMGLLAHEVLHPALGHLWRRGGRNHELWNMAVDFAANDIIRRMIPNVELPAGGLYDPRFQGMAAEQIYSILEKESKSRPKRTGGDGHLEKTVQRQGQGGKGQSKGKPQPGEKDQKGKGGSDEKGKGEKGKGEGQGGKGKGKDEKKDGAGQGSGKREDKDDVQEESERRREEAERKEKGKQDKGQGREASGADEDQGEGEGEKDGGEGEKEGRSNAQHEGHGGEPESDEGSLDDVKDGDMEQHWQDVLIQAAMVAKQKGNLPAQLARLVEDVTAPKVPWQQVIEQFLTEVLRDDYDMLKQDRRFIEQGIYFPDLQSNATNVAVAVDTSGSIGKKELTAFVSEMAGILRCRGIATVRVMACDAEITLDEKIGPTDPLPENYPGGGGTDFRPVFKRLVDDSQTERPALLVYLTDGCGTYPDKDELGIPVIWLMTTNAYMKEENLPTPPFGVRVPYPIEEADRE